MAKYDPLTRHLAERQQPLVPMTFPELEAVLGFPLPPSARKDRGWWSNNPQNNVMTRAWLAAGYRSRDVDLAAERLLFERLNAVEPAERPRGRHPLIGCMRGLITIQPGTDLTEPVYTDAEMDAFMERKLALLAGNDT
jgi:hypothetical protein